MLALVPVFFGIQQGVEGRVWQELEAGSAEGARSYALLFHFFSHFLWLWWLPLCSYLMESNAFRKRIFAGFAAIGALIGATGYTLLVFHPEWMTVSVVHHSIDYDVIIPFRSNVSIPIPASIPYAMIILLPLLFSSHQALRNFGVMVALSMVLAMLVYGYALVSVWCFLAAALSFYMVYIIQIKGEKSLICIR